MDINELIRLSEQAEKHRRMIDGIDTYDQIAKQQALFDEAEKRRRIIDSIDSYRLEEIARQTALIDKTMSLGAISYKDAINERLSGLASDLAQIEKANIIASPLFDSINEANRKALDMIQNSAIKDTFRAIAGVENFETLAGVRAKDWLKFQEHLAPKIEMEKFLDSHLLGIAEKSLLAQSALVNMDFEKIGLGLRVEDEIRRIYSDDFLNFSNSYKDLFKSFEVPQTSIFTLPPHLTELPTLEFYTGVDLAETTFEYDEEIEFQEEREIERENIQIIVTDSLETYLTSVNPDLRILRAGAKEAFSSNNPDKIRHCITSLRELVTQVMHHLSPDAEIKIWSQSEADYANGRPTRRTRLRFIARHINHGTFTEFVEKDLAATLAAIDLFNAGTHKVKSSLTERQLQALITKVETTLLFLFEIGNSTEH